MATARRRALAGLVFAVILVLVFLAGMNAAPRAEVTPLRVFAPWCMEKRLRRIAEVFQETHPNTPVCFTTGTPGYLLRKIKAGERPGVYIAMGPSDIEALGALGLPVPGTAKDILEQTLLLAVSAEAQEEVKHLRDLAKEDITAAGIGPPAMTSGRLTRVALERLGILETVLPKAKTPPLRALALGQAQASVLYEECCYEEDLLTGRTVLRRGIAAAEPLPKELCEPFPVTAVVLKTTPAHPDAADFISVLIGERGRDILHRRGDWSTPVREPAP